MKSTWVLAIGLVLTATAPPVASSAGLMVHVPFDGAIADTRGLGAVRADQVGTPTFITGPDGEAALPGPGSRHVAMLHVSRLSRLLLRGRTPEAGTIMLWVKRPDPALAPADTAPVLVLSSDAPLNLDVALGGAPPRLVAAFDDEAGLRHETALPLPAAAAAGSWVHLALGWDAGAGTTVAFVQGEALENATGKPFVMPKLPGVFALGAADTPIDDFRLYDRLLDAAAVRALPGFPASH